MEDCSAVPWWCQVQCAVLNTCRSGHTPIGGANCQFEESDLAFCEARPPFYIPPIIVIVVPPPPCPEGQHRNGEGECQDDYECGDDEIGGGSEECETCGAGQVPNEDGTECVECEHGEFEAGECASLCSNAELDSAAATSLGGIPREPWERLESYTCDSEGQVHIKLLGSSQNASDVCEVRADGSPVSSAYGHSHPYFEYPRDKNVHCRGTVIKNQANANRLNEGNRDFSSGDRSGARSRGKPLYLVVPERDEVKVYRKTGKTGFWGGDIWAVETVR